MMDGHPPAQGKSSSPVEEGDEGSSGSSNHSSSSTNSNKNDLPPATTAYDPDNRSTSTQSDIPTNGNHHNNNNSCTTSYRRSLQIEEEHLAGGPRTSLVSGGGSETCSYNTSGSNNNNNRALADTSQNSGASSVLPASGVGGGGPLHHHHHHHHHQGQGQQEPVNFGVGADSSSVVSSPTNRATGGDVFSRRVTLVGGSSGGNLSSGMVSGGTAGVLSTSDNHRRNSLSSLSLMDDIFGKRASMGLGSTAATALSAMGAGGGGHGGGMSNSGMGMGGGGDMDSTAMMSVVGSGGNMGSGGSMFGRRGSMDSTTAALDAAIFDLTRRRYSMANSSLVGGGGVGAMGSLVAGGAGAATINSLAGGDRSYIGMGGHHSNQEFGNAGNFDSSGRGGMGGSSGMDAARRTSLDMASSGGGGSVGGGMGSGGGMDFDNNMMGSGGMGLNLPSNVTSGMGNSGMMDQFVQQHQQQRMRSMTTNLAARQQQLQAQQRELERRQPSHYSQSFGAGNNSMGGNDMRYEGLMHQQQGGGGVGNAGGMKTNFNDPLTGPYNMGGMGVQNSNAGLGNTMSNSDHSSRGGMGTGTHNSGGGGSHSSGSQQWWICQVCNTKAFASHDEALAHEAICAQQQGHVNNLNISNNSSSNRGHYDPQDDSHFNYISSASSPQSQRNRISAGRHRTNPRGMDMSGSTNTGKYTGGGMDNSMRTIHTSATSTSYEPVYSTGPFATLDKPLPLAMPTDKDWLTPLHCFVRKHCVEVFCASEDDVAAPSKGKRKPIQVGQIGIRCPHCHPNSPSLANKKSGSADSAGKIRERGSVYYPTTIASIYNATMNLLQRHLHSCTAVPPEIMSRYETLKSDDARSGTSKKYWIESALSIGLVDTEMGIRFSAATPPPLPQLTDSQKDMQKHIKDQTNTSPEEDDDDDHEGEDGRDRAQQLDRSDTNEDEPSLLTAPEDKAYSTAFSYHLLSQMKPCVFTEADRLGKRKGLPPGFRGLACRFCFGGYGSGRFFPSSIKTLSDTSKTLNVLHNHMIRCRKCPAAVRETLEQLRGTHDEERAKMKFGSQKAFFARIWDRLHGTGKASEKPASSPEKSPKNKSDGDDTPPSSSAKPAAKRKAPPSATSGAGESSTPPLSSKKPPPASTNESERAESTKKRPRVEHEEDEEEEEEDPDS
ncbi:hypothetical protein ACA910_016062 [Epithemia clementina (nom. ined.)]